MQHLKSTWLSNKALVAGLVVFTAVACSKKDKSHDDGAPPEVVATPSENQPSHVIIGQLPVAKPVVQPAPAPEVTPAPKKRIFAEAEVIDIAKLKSGIAAEGYKSIEEVIEQLPYSFRRNHMLLTKGDSDQGASVLEPRVAMYGETAKTVVVFTSGGERQRGRNILQVWEFNDNESQYELHRFAFPIEDQKTLEVTLVKTDGRLPAEMLPSINNPTYWQNAFGKAADQIIPGTKEATDLVAFKRFADQHPRYKFLGDSEYFANRISPFQIPGATRYLGDMPNQRLALLFNRWDMRRAYKELQKSAKFERYKYALSFLLNPACNDLPRDLGNNVDWFFDMLNREPELVALADFKLAIDNKDLASTRQLLVEYLTESKIPVDSISQYGTSRRLMLNGLLLQQLTKELKLTKRVPLSLTSSATLAGAGLPDFGDLNYAKHVLKTLDQVTPAMEAGSKVCAHLAFAHYVMYLGK